MKTVQMRMKLEDMPRVVAALRKEMGRLLVKRAEGEAPHVQRFARETAAVFEAGVDDTGGGP